MLDSVLYAELDLMSEEVELLLEKKSFKAEKSSKSITVLICTECRESIDSHGYRKNDWFPHKPNCSLYKPPVKKV